MQLTHQTAGDAEPDPCVPHSPQMRSSHSRQMITKSSHSPQMKAVMGFVSQTDASLSLTKANMILVCETMSQSLRHGLIGFVHTQGSSKTSCTVMTSVKATKAFTIC